MNPAIEKLESRRLLAAGDIDHTFGDDGILAEAESTNTAIEDSVLLAGDKLLVGGGKSVGDNNFGDPDYFLRRYNADGSPDTSFGTAGTVTGRFDPAVACRIQEIHPTTGGKFVALARNFGADDFPQDFFIARFNADGTLDNTFSGDGWLPHSVTLGWATAVVQADGAIVVAVEGKVTRYTAAGVLDTSFGDNGAVTDALGEHGWIFDMKVQSDGTIVAGGLTNVNGDENNCLFALAKLNTDGSPVTSFGNDGIVTTQVDPQGQPQRFEIIRDLIILPDGKILANGEGNSGITVARYLSNGDLDTSFGSNGIIDLPGGSNWSEAFLDSDDRVYISNGVITRLTADGEVDPTFGRVFGGADARNSNTYYGGIVAGFNDDGQIVLIGVRDTFNHNETPPGEDQQHIVQVRRLTEDDGNPSPITLSSGTVTITATNTGDFLTASDFNVVSAAVNGQGRMFDLQDVDLIFCDGAGGDDYFFFDDTRSTSVHLKGGDGRDRIIGGHKNDTLEGNAHGDVIYGGNGADLIIGNGGKDKLHGEGGWDHMYGGAGNDGIRGNGGRDRISGGAGVDHLIGDEADDTFLAADGAVDRIFGGDGSDTATVDDDDILLDGVETTI